MLYCALFFPYLNNCVEVRGTASKCYVSLITLEQKKVIRISAKVDKYSRTDPLFKDLKILKFTDLIRFHILPLMFTLNRSQLSSNLQMKFISNDYNLLYSLRSKGKFKVSYARTCLKAKCFSIYGVKIFQ